MTFDVFIKHYDRIMQISNNVPSFVNVSL